MATQTQAELGLAARVAYSRILIDKVREDNHPSAAQLTLIEQTIPPQIAHEYLDVLLSKVAGENHPSIPLLTRIQRIIMGLG